MLKAIASVVAGYLVMFVVVASTILLAYAAIGPERAFKPGSYDVTTGWWLASIGLGLAGALAGGFACARIAPRGSRAPRVLAGLTFGLGLLMAVPAVTAKPDPATQARPPDAGLMCAMRDARTPPVAAILNPVIGAAGVLAGARLRSRAENAAG